MCSSDSHAGQAPANTARLHGPDAARAAGVSWRLQVSSYSDAVTVTLQRLPDGSPSGIPCMQCDAHTLHVLHIPVWSQASLCLHLVVAALHGHAVFAAAQSLQGCLRVVTTLYRPIGRQLLVSRSQAPDLKR